MSSSSDTEWLAPVISLSSARSESRARSIESDVASEAGGAGAAESRVCERSTKRAHNVSIAALARRGMSEWEMVRLLESRELDGETVDLELARLRESGLLDDAVLAENLVRSLHERKGLGRTAIISELRRRHLDTEVIDAALMGLDGDAEAVVLESLAIHRAAQLDKLDPEVARRRLSGYLMRKGYSGSLLREAIDKATADWPKPSASRSGFGSRMSQRPSGADGTGARTRVRFR